MADAKGRGAKCEAACWLAIRFRWFPQRTRRCVWRVAVAREAADRPGRVDRRGARLVAKSMRVPEVRPREELSEPISVQYRSRTCDTSRMSRDCHRLSSHPTRLASDSVVLPSTHSSQLTTKSVPNVQHLHTISSARGINQTMGLAGEKFVGAVDEDLMCPGASSANACVLLEQYAHATVCSLCPWKRFYCQYNGRVCGVECGHEGPKTSIVAHERAVRC